MRMRRRNRRSSLDGVDVTLGLANGMPVIRPKRADLVGEHYIAEWLKLYDEYATIRLIERERRSKTSGGGRQTRDAEERHGANSPPDPSA